MNKDFKKYIELLRYDLQKALRAEDYDAVFDILGFLNKEDLEGLNDEEINLEKGYAFFRLAALYDQQEDKAKELAEYYGIEADSKKAVDLYTRAATLGDAQALSPLYSLYSKAGQTKKAEKILDLGVKMGQPKCCYIRGMEYLKAKDYESALSLFKEAYEQAPEFGGYELGKMYENGWGVEKNTEEAFYYYLDAANCGDKMAMKEVGLAYCDSGDYDEARIYLEESLKQGLNGKKRNFVLSVLDSIEGKESKKETSRARKE